MAGQRLHRAALAIVEHEEVYPKAYENLSEARCELAAYFESHNYTGAGTKSLSDHTPHEVYQSTLRRQSTAA